MCIIWITNATTFDFNAASFHLTLAGALVTMLLPHKVEQMSTAQLDSTQMLPTSNNGEGFEVGPKNVPSWCGVMSAMVLYYSYVYRSFSTTSWRMSEKHTVICSSVRPLVPMRSGSEVGVDL